jgi:hypothetical protein
VVNRILIGQGANGRRRIIDAYGILLLPLYHL